MATNKSPIKDHNLQIAATPDKLSCPENSSISSSSSLNKPIILQLNTNSFSASQKLKSLLPKSLLHQALRQEPEVKSYPVSHETELQPGAFGNNISGFATNDAAIHAQSSDAENKDNLNAASIDFGYSVTTLEAIESILRQLNSNISPSNILETNADKQQQPEFDQSVEKCGSFGQESLHNEPDTNETQTLTTSNPVVTSHEINPEGSAPPVSHDSSEDQDDQNVVKKTMVEAFVKMVVCRKVTVQKVHAKTGEILETKVKTVCFIF